MSRVEDTPEGSWICLSHRNLILAEDKRCSMFLQFLAHAQTFDRGVAAEPQNRWPRQPGDKVVLYLVSGKTKSKMAKLL